jgi:hypothetical protein
LSPQQLPPQQQHHHRPTKARRRPPPTKRRGTRRRLTLTLPAFDKHPPPPASLSPRPPDPARRFPLARLCIRVVPVSSSLIPSSPSSSRLCVLTAPRLPSPSSSHPRLLFFFSSPPRHVGQPGLPHPAPRVHPAWHQPGHVALSATRLARRRHRAAAHVHVAVGLGRPRPPSSHVGVGLSRPGHVADGRVRLSPQQHLDLGRLRRREQQRHRRR